MSSVSFKAGDSLGELLKKHDWVSDDTLLKILLASKERHVRTSIKKIPENATLTLFRNAAHCEFNHARVSLGNSKELVLINQGDEIEFTVFNRIKQIRDIYTSFPISDSLYFDGVVHGVPESLLAQIDLMFSSRYDFHTDLRSGDRFELIYQQLNFPDRQHQIGDLMLVKYQRVNGDNLTLYRFPLKKGGSIYVDDNGLSSSQSFLRNPLKFTRISSHFNPRRKHPILSVIKAHKGTDYAAPVGTPVWATADGEISYRGWNGGYGKMIKINHGRHYQTVYAHLSRYANSSRKGRKVKQGQIIGYVGSTGLSTGPHLHYELIVRGRHLNPVKAKYPMKKLPKGSKPLFKQYRQEYLERLKTLTNSGIRLAEKR